MVAKPAVDLAELGKTGLVRTGGYVYEEFLLELRGNRATKVYKEMSANDPVIAAVLFAVDMLIRQATWRVEPADTTPKAKEVAEFVESCRGDMSMTWEEMISGILSLLVYGWAYTEICYKLRQGPNADATKRSKYSDGKIGWRKIPIRAQDTLQEWVFDETGGVQAMIQSSPPDYQIITIPIEKALLFRTQAQKGNPEGRSVLRSCYQPYYFKKRIQEIEAVGIERDLAGLPVAWVPPRILDSNAPAADKAVLTALKQIVANIRRDAQEGVIFPVAYDEAGHKVYDLTLLSTGGSRQFDTDKVIARYDQRIAMTVLADFILLGHEAVGSFALSTSKTRLFSMALQAWANDIAAVFNRYAIPRLTALNGFPEELNPTLEVSEIDTPDLVVLSEFLNKMAGVGMPLFPDEALEAYIRQAAKLPEKSEEARAMQEAEQQATEDERTAAAEAAAQQAAQEQTQTQASVLPAERQASGETNAVAKGGPGSGNWGHAGRPGEMGGSAPDGGGSSGSSTGNGVPEGNATGGENRTIAGRKYNTADVVNQVLNDASAVPLDTERSRSVLELMGHRNPTTELVADHARQRLVLDRLSRAVSVPAISAQIGKWDFSSAQTIHDSFNSYLGRRIGGQHARWTQSHKR